jgi:hypothetical protein
MSDADPSVPLLYEAGFEMPEEDEGKSIAELAKVMVKMAATVCSHTGHAMRAVHAKGHGLVRAELQVLAGCDFRFLFACGRGPGPMGLAYAAVYRHRQDAH